MSAHDEEMAAEVEIDANERNSETSATFFPEMIGKESRRTLNRFTLRSLP